jgi:glycosyltransferase involved in cell wall biosynthesis
MKILAKQPTISIVTPCYNSGKYLEETILSVLDQNYQNLEYIIIDGGSTDNSIDIIKKYEKKLFYWTSEKDNGMYDAIQKGFDKSSGEIMAWINADDLYHRKSLFIVSEIFSKFCNINWLVGASTHWDEYGRGINANYSYNFTRYDFLMGNFKWIQQESCFFRRQLWEKAGAYIDNTLLYAGDFELWLRFFRHDKLYITNALIGGFRMRSSNQLSLEGMPKYLNEVESILKKEPITKKEKIKIKRYKIIYSILKFISKIIEKTMNKYRNIEFGITNNIGFNRKTQEFELKL